MRIPGRIVEGELREHRRVRRHREIVDAVHEPMIGRDRSEQCIVVKETVEAGNLVVRGDPAFGFAAIFILFEQHRQAAIHWDRFPDNLPGLDLGNLAALLVFHVEIFECDGDQATMVAIDHDALRSDREETGPIMVM